MTLSSVQVLATEEVTAQLERCRSVLDTAVNLNVHLLESFVLEQERAFANAAMLGCRACLDCDAARVRGAAATTGAFARVAARVSSVTMVIGAFHRQHSKRVQRLAEHSAEEVRKLERSMSTLEEKDRMWMEEVSAAKAQVYTPEQELAVMGRG